MSDNHKCRNRIADFNGVHLKKGEGNVLQDCDIMIDHIRAIDNKRLVRKVGELSQELKKDIKDNIKIVLDLE
jgi:mRNA interferase MazF